ncbi:hypothetical protein JCM18897A_43190 [Streptomyces sp. JCM 18897]
MPEVELALSGQVEQAARGADDDVDALVERLHLGLVGAAAVYGEDADVADLARGEQVVGDLLAQLAGGDHDEGLRGGGELLGLGPARLDVGGDGDALQQGEAETEGLARTGLGLADDVGAREGDRQRQLLDGKGVGDADGFEGLGGLGKDSEFSKGSQGAGLFCETRYEANAGILTVPLPPAAAAEGGGPGGTGPQPTLERSCR